MEIKTIKVTNYKLDVITKDYLLKKMVGLHKFFKHFSLPQDLFIEIGKTTKHHKKGKFFRAEAVLKLAGKILRAESEEYDLRAAIDAVYNELARQIKGLKGKLQAKQAYGARLAKLKDN